jgi:hypothetical protein
MIEKLEGWRTVIVFGVFLLNGVLNLLGWGLELPAELNEWAVVILSLIALLLRGVTKTPVFKASAKG